MRYQNFDLWIDPGNGNGYHLRAVSEKFGVVRESMDLNPEDPDLRDNLTHLAQRDTDRQFLVQFGSKLYRQLFRGKIEALFQQSYGAVMSQEDLGLRLRLRIIPPEITVLPWELLYSPIAECFIGTMLRCPIVRYLDILKPVRDLETQFPLRVLVAIPGNLINYPPLDAKKEKTNLLEALGDLQDLIEIKFIENNVTITDISDALLEHCYHCVHFIGHGNFQQNRGFLLLNNGNGGIDYVDESRFAALFQNHETVKLVVLNSCEGASLSSTRPFVGMAPQLVQLGVPAVVAMQYAIYDDVAVLFARSFYRSLFKGYSKGRVEVAMSNARNLLAREFPDDRDVATPVLFLRAPDGVLFNPVTRSLLRDFPLAKAERNRQDAVANSHRHNAKILEEFQTKAYDANTEQELLKELEEYRIIKRRIRLRNYLLATALVVILFVFYLSWIRVFDFFTLDTRIETATIWLGDLFTTKHFNDDLFLITINDESEDFFGQDFDTSWRKKHALLIDLLSQAGTRTIAFAFMFSDPGPYDEEFIQAVRTANQRGTSVVVGMEQTGGFGVTDLDELRQAVSGYGPFCVGKKLGLASLAPLMIIKDDGSRVSSFILTAIAAYQGTPHYKLDPEAKTIRFFGANSHRMENIYFSVLDKVKSDQGACQIRQGDVVADILVDISPVETLRNPARGHAYHEFFQGKEPDQLAALKDKIVLVGKTDTDEMKYQVFNGFPSAGYQRYGLELVADAINTVMNGINIHSMGELGQLLIMIALGLLGGLVRYWVSPTRRYRRISIVIFILCMYLGSTIIIYAVYRVLLNTLYHVGALSIAYWATGKVERKWLA